MSDSLVGKEAEKKIQEWLDRPDEGYSIDRVKDQMTGFYGSKNICDFTCFKSPWYYYIESKATYEPRFDFSMITDTQYQGLLEKSKIKGVYGLVPVLFASYKRAFLLDIRIIDKMKTAGIKSINIENVDSENWIQKVSVRIGVENFGDIMKKCELRTIPNNRKKHLDYRGNIEEYVIGGHVL